MKKFMLFSIMVISMFILSSCNKNNEKITVGVLKGPTGISFAEMMENNEKNNLYEFEVAGSPDEITPRIISGELNIAAIPSNLASIIYNKTNGEISVLNINTLGTLYIVGKEGLITNISDLKGKTIYASGLGAVPEYVLNFILSSNNIDLENDVKIEYKSEHTETLTALLGNKEAVALLPEPFVTTAKIKDSSLKILVDLTKEWEKVSPESSLIMGVVIARSDFIEKNKSFVNKFLEDSKKSINAANENPKLIGEYSEKFGIINKEIAEKAIPNCNLNYIDGNDMELKLKGFLEVLNEINPASIGGTLPNENFYYKK